MHVLLTEVSTVGSIDWWVAVIAIVIGLLSIVLITRVNRSMGGQIKSAIQFFVVGIDMNVVAIFLSIVGIRNTLVFGQVVDIQNLIIMFGMVFFIISARQLSTLLARI